MTSFGGLGVIWAERVPIYESNTAKIAAVWANPGHRVTANSPLVLLHASETDLKIAVASPAKRLLFAATMTQVFLPLSLSSLFVPLHALCPVGATSSLLSTVFWSRGGVLPSLRSQPASVPEGPTTRSEGWIT